jgi:hypothetical protein
MSFRSYILGNARQELLQVKGLCRKRCRSLRYPRLPLHAGGHDHNRKICAKLPPNVDQDFLSRHQRELQVEQYQIRRLRSDRHQRAAAVAKDASGKASAFSALQ